MSCLQLSVEPRRRNFAVLRLLQPVVYLSAAPRRSAVARQAAHLFAELAAALGIKFDQYAITFMSALYKGLVITVQVG